MISSSISWTVSTRASSPRLVEAEVAMACLIQKNLVDADLINNKIDESLQLERESVLREEDMGGSRVLLSEREGAELLVLTRLASSGSGVWGKLPETLAESFGLSFGLRVGFRAQSPKLCPKVSG